MKAVDLLKQNATARLEWLASKGWSPALLALAAGDGTSPEAFIADAASTMFVIDRLAAELAVEDPSALLSPDFDPASDPEPGAVADDRLGRWFIGLPASERRKAAAMFEQAGRPLPTAAAAWLRNEREQADRAALDAAVDAELEREENATREARRAAIRARLARDRA